MATLWVGLFGSIRLWDGLWVSKISNFGGKQVGGATDYVPKIVQRYQRIFPSLSSYIKGKVASLEGCLHDSGGINS